MATLTNWLDAATALPADIESKFTKLPKLSQGLRKFDAMLPVGIKTLPTPPTFPAPDLTKLPNPPDIFTQTNARMDRRTITEPATARLPAGYIPPSMLNLAKTTITSTNPAGGKTGEVITRRGY